MAVYDHIVVKDGIWYESGADVPEDVPVDEKPVDEKPAKGNKKK